MRRKEVNKCIKQLCGIIEELGQIYDTKRVLSDFLTASAVCISNRDCGISYIEREELYANTLKRYEKEHKLKFPEMFELLKKALNYSEREYRDVLSEVFDVIKTRSNSLKQNFSPESVGRIMAEMHMSTVASDIEKKGFIAVNDPTCGSGTLILKYAEELSYSYNPQTQMCATLIDVDFTCVCAAYIQLSFYGIPAVVIHGDVLKAQENSRWYTHAYVAGGWVWKCKCAIVDRYIKEDEILKRASEPIYAAIQKLNVIERKNDDNTKNDEKENGNDAGKNKL